MLCLLQKIRHLHRNIEEPFTTTTQKFCPLTECTLPYFYAKHYSVFWWMHCLTSFSIINRKAIITVVIIALFIIEFDGNS
jgi:hypothetical protein